MGIRRNDIDRYNPSSLVEYFEPNENYIGVFGWVCGYSASPDFLNLALERFRGKTKSIRAREGNINLVMLLDKGNPQISMVNVPGLYHAGRDGNQVQPFRLLHAKVALLLFKNILVPQKYTVRLVVCTGNWTEETLSESLDLVCALELSSDDFKLTESSKRQTRSDIYHAWDFVKELRTYFSFSIVMSRKEKESFLSFDVFEKVLGSITKPKGIGSRFFDNRKQSLLKQLPGIISNTASNVVRNYLAMGSGFFQKPSSKEGVPSVIQNIYHALQSHGLLTSNPQKELFVNPDACQAIADSQKSLYDNDWNVIPAQDPLNHKRTLHAKFLFSANERVKSNSCASPWIYLGSGNLTQAGFTNSMSSIGGNLEAGIVISPENLLWESKYESSDRHHLCVDQRMPMYWNNDSDSYLPTDLHSGEDMADRTDDFVAAPVSWFYWSVENGIGCLRPGEICKIEYYVQGPGNIKCNKDEEGRWLWDGAQPSLVEVKWGSNDKHSALVPVVDSLGRIAGKQLETIDLEEAWWQLESYPNFSVEEDDLDSEILENESLLSSQISAEKNHKTASYPIRVMMKLVENIADKQTALTKSDWMIWCNRLEQSLIQTKGNHVYTVFQEMNINPLSPLRHAAFRPEFAEDSSSIEGKHYELVLDRVEDVLNLKNLNNI